jgi:glycogen operon protein
MVLAGDECGRTQQGNNNAYSQDNDISWLDWQAAQAPAAAELTDFLRRLIAGRKAHPVLRRRSFLHGQERSDDGLVDVAWYSPHGKQMTPEQWQDPLARCIGVIFNGRAGPDIGADGTPVYDDVLLTLLNAHHEPVPFVLPRLPGGSGWRRILDTSQPALTDDPQIQAMESKYPLPGRCLVQFTMLEEATAP